MILFFLSKSEATTTYTDIFLIVCLCEHNKFEKSRNYKQQESVLRISQTLQWYLFYLFSEKGKGKSYDNYAMLLVRWYEFVRQVLSIQDECEIVKEVPS